MNEPLYQQRPKKTVYKLCEIKLEHELDLYYREFECPHCIGGAELHDLTEINGQVFWDKCDECGGAGILYLEDCRPCEYCDKKIYFEQIDGKWLPFNADTDTRHSCPNYWKEKQKESAT